MDKNFLSTKAYPYLHDVARFVENITYLKDGKRLIALSSSPEYHNNDITAWFMIVRFILSPEDLGDQTKADALRSILRQITATHARGHRINKITVTPEGYVVYVFNNEAYFLGLAPEGSVGFLFGE